MPEFRNQYTVSELNAQIRFVLEGSFSDIWVTGEISNFHYHPSSGHMYFTIKDDRGEMKCAMFRSNNQYLKFKPTDGMEVRVLGSVSIYEQRGQVQLIVSRMEPAGLGDLFKAFEALKKTLSEEGLFDAIHKNPIPKFPRKIGIITSGSGAALQDILNVLNRRSPQVDILVRSTKVQGDESAQDISNAIQEFNDHGLVDVIIVGRGGGSIEDLWSFNEEIVSRSIFESTIPIISAVGHETDFTIADFVADLKAPTPSIAAELATTPLKDILILLIEIKKRFKRVLKKDLEQAWILTDHLEARVLNQQPQKKIQRQVERLTQFLRRLCHGISTNQNHFNEKTEALQKQLTSLGPKRVLDRGYAVALMKNGDLIRNAVDVSVGDSFSLKTGNGSFGAEKTTDNPNY